jgi:hypothetical protein
MMKYSMFDDALKNATYVEINRRLQQATNSQLIALLDSKSIRIGDSAAGVLGARKKHQLIIDAILAQQLKTSLGRLRASSSLLAFGKNVPRAVEAYSLLLDDRSRHVIDNALLGLVFMQEVDNIPAIEAAKIRAAERGKPVGQYDLAIRALKQDNPFIFAPWYGVQPGVWDVTEEQLATRERLQKRKEKGKEKGSECVGVSRGKVADGRVVRGKT